jgi:DNA-binding SARP family transcriptional activator/tetratricopeptide (TPR) repeat protein
MIQLHTLGTLVLRHSNGEDIQSVLAQPKRVALLAYLTIARPLGFHRRDTLHALLWPEQDEQHARWALNQALRHLRTALGKEVVASRGDGEVGIDPEALSCDAVEFEAAIEANDPGRALELYRGELLDGFHVSGCGDFERWLEEERVWLRRRAAQAASDLAQLKSADGEAVAAGHWARRALALAPDDEGEARRLIELLNRLGDRAGAVQAYEEFARRLREEYEVEPAPETRALIASVRTRQAVLEPGVEQKPMTVAASGEEGVAGPRRALLVLGALTLVTVGALGWGLLSDRPPPFPPPAASTTLAVLPFGYRGSSEFAYLGEGMTDLLSANLDGAGDLHTVDPDAVIALVRQAGARGSDPEYLGKAVARLSAGSFVLGDVVEAAGRLHISARLYTESSQEQPPVKVMVQGAASQLFQLVDGLTARLIAGRSGGPGSALTRLAALTTDSLAALKAYLEGERQFRAGRMDSTVQTFQRAIKVDSSFALAHYRLATAAMWADRRPLSRQAVERALRFGSRLSDRDQRLIKALAASLHGRIAEAERIYREIVTRHPEDLEASYQLGDLIFHRRAVLGRSWLDAREPFERVLSIDPKHESALYHLSNIATRERRLGELDSLTHRILQIVPPPAWFFRGQRAVAFADTAEVSGFASALRKYSDDIAQPTAGLVVFTTGDLIVGRRLWRMLTEPSRSRGVRVLAHVTLARIELMSGRWTAAKVELETARALDPATALEHRALLSLWPLLSVSDKELQGVRQSLLQWKATSGPPSESGLTGEHAAAHPFLRLYLLGLLSGRLGEYPNALRYSAELDRRAATSFAPGFVRDLSRGIRVEVARSRGRPAQALTILDSLGFWTQDNLDLTGSSPFYAHEYDQFTRAELLNLLGRDREALQAFGAIADELFHSGAPAHLRLAQIYERQDERQKAADHYARFIGLWKDCDPELQPVLEEAKRRVVK